MLTIFNICCGEKKAMNMAMSHRRKRFVPPTREQQASALGETDTVSIHSLSNAIKIINIISIISARCGYSMCFDNGNRRKFSTYSNTD